MIIEFFLLQILQDYFKIWYDVHVFYYKGVVI